MQVYLTDIEASVEVPIRKLVGFQRITLEPGQSKTVELTLTPKDIALIDNDGKCVLEPGVFKITVGGSQGDDRSRALGAADVATAQFELEGEKTYIDY